MTMVMMVEPELFKDLTTMLRFADVKTSICIFAFKLFNCFFTLGDDDGNRDKYDGKPCCWRRHMGTWKEAGGRGAGTPRHTSPIL